MYSLCENAVKMLTIAKTQCIFNIGVSMDRDINTRKIKNLMKEYKLTIEELAKRCGVSKKEIRKIMQDRKDFLYNTLCRISEYFQIDISELIIKEEIEIPKFYTL